MTAHDAGPTGSEALKNLVLGGIASFTIVDGTKVAAVDLGNNFFLEAESLGAPRAQSVARLLSELNEAVAGSFVEEEPAALEDMERLITEFHDNSRCGPRASAHDLERVMSSCSSQR